ncbi:MAG: hypothetical protein DRJ38_04335 [Thermoprotei archaeon]|nr:MAG: hypothetical protein DRJ38_04335 [Thermoprotei archaeon]
MNLKNIGEEYDVAIVGAGPAGLFLANLIKDLDFIVLEEHREVGKPLHCAGLLSLKGLKRIGFMPQKSIQNKVRGAIFISPSGLKLIVESRRDEAVVVNRTFFDKELAEKVSDNIKLRTKVVKVAKRSGKWILKTGSGSIRSKILVDAEGFRYNLSTKLGFEKPPKDLLLPAIQVELEKIRDLNRDLVEIYLGSKWAPGFFAWIIPLSEDEARVGLAARELPFSYLKNFLGKHPIASSKLKKAKVKRILGGRVVLTGIYGKIAKKSSILIGDVAGQTKPTTGGGVVYSGIAAHIASNIIREELAKNSGEIVLEEYDKAWRRLMGRELFLMKTARRFMMQINDKDYDEMIKKMKEIGFESVAERDGDMDFQYKILKKIIMTPSLYISQLPYLLTAFIKSLLTS